MSDPGQEREALTAAWEEMRPRTPEEFLTPKIYFYAGVSAARAAREEPQGEDVEIVARHLAERDHGGSPRHGGQSTALVTVKAEDVLGLVRVRLSLDAPSYLLSVSQARNLGELLIEAADKLTHRDPEQEPER